MAAAANENAGVGTRSPQRHTTTTASPPGPAAAARWRMLLSATRSEHCSHATAIWLDFVAFRDSPGPAMSPHARLRHDSIGRGRAVVTKRG
eukprot:scaffold70466_cov76-Phaeocystis_antarctica.AAC.2